ncbi:hypothetical protein HPB49_010696 [Dermacentor silvarum]|uniref:Uncharacterized protein n=1 Tax=Dermacentor silvarum TaxID=543639 RepID=A0ACB8C8Q2_DERSI|nr:hypothetical protein HPB49_010696 [Dermacentor silvarum]
MEKFHKRLRNRWIAAVRRVNHDGKPWKPSKNARICSNHFYKGEPSRVPSDPDYVPSKFTYRPARSGVLPRSNGPREDKVWDLFHDGDINRAAKAVPNSAESVSLHAAICEDDPVPGEPEDSSLEAGDSGAHHPRYSKAEYEDAEALIDIPVVCQANVLQKDLEQTRTALAESQKLAHYWKERYESSRERFLSVNPIWQPRECQYYTGMPSYVVFEGIYKAFSSAMPQVTRGPSRALRGAEEFLMVLVRLRTGMPVKEVARNFGITVSSFSKIFS